MSDRFKFRAWHNKDKAMVCDSLMSQTAFNRDGVSIFYDVFHSGWYEIMQCTCLKDKNGVLIFESDILDLGQTVNGCSKFVVVWDDERIGWNVRYGVKMTAPRNYEYSVSGFFTIDDMLEDGVEIIGNIHENPELLEGEK